MIDSLSLIQMGRRIFEKLTYNLGDGAKVIYIPNYVINPDDLFEELKTTIPWRRYKYEVHGKEVTSPRLMHIIHFGLSESSDESDDDQTSSELNLPLLEKIKKRVEKITGVEFKYGVLNYYRDGNDYIGFHPDREVGPGHMVVSVSVGATRRFVLKHKFREGVKHKFMLANGDVLIMNEAAIKTMYKHSIPKMANVGPRINITFRQEE